MNQSLFTIFKSRIREPSTWAALAAGVAILTGRDPTLAANTVVQIVGGIATLVGILMAENSNPPVT